MRGYAKVSPKFWTGTTGKAIRKQGHESVIVALYLMTAPMSNMLGLYYQPMLYIAHETGLGNEGASKGLQGCIDAGFCHYDDASEMVWVLEMASYQVGNHLKAADKRCIGIQKEYESLQPCAFVDQFFDRYASDFHIEDRRGFEAPSEALRSQELEQEQEQEKEVEPASLRSASSTAKPRDKPLLNLAERKGKRLAAITDDAISAYNRILANPSGLLASVRPVGKKNRQEQVKRCQSEAADICRDQFDSPVITPEFWESYFRTCSEDSFLSGRGPYTGDHAGWRPDFEYLVRPKTLIRVYERAVSGVGS